MQSNLDVALSFVFNDEGGFAIRDNEPGGACNKGVSQLVLAAWRSNHGGAPADGPPLFSELKKIGTVEATAIYTFEYAGPTQFANLPSGLDYAMLNTAVMQGVVGAVKLLQAAVGMDQHSGHMDIITWSHIKLATAWSLVPKLLDEQLKLKRADPRYDEHLDKDGNRVHGFGPGWEARISRVKRRAKAIMLQGGKS